MRSCVPILALVLFAFPQVGFAGSNASNPPPIYTPVPSYAPPIAPLPKDPPPAPRLPAPEEPKPPVVEPVIPPAPIFMPQGSSCISYILVSGTCKTTYGTSTLSQCTSNAPGTKFCQAGFMNDGVILQRELETIYSTMAQCPGPESIGKPCTYVATWEISSLASNGALACDDTSKKCVKK